MLAVGAGGVDWTFFFSRLSFLSFFSFSLGDGLRWTEILSQRAVKLKPTNNIFNKTKFTSTHCVKLHFQRLIFYTEISYIFTSFLY